MPRAIDKSRALSARLNARGIPAATDQADKLRRAEMTLHRWAEGECGDGNDRASWCIVRDEDGKTYREMHPHNGKSYRVRIRDLETGALNRVREVCESLGAHFYHQGDPRGCALYVDAEPLTDTAYTRGVAIQ